MGGNKTVMINPDGKEIFRYFKSEPVPGEWSIKGKGIIKYVDTIYGR